jgi:hypothetical protein
MTSDSLCASLHLVPLKWLHGQILGLGLFSFPMYLQEFPSRHLLLRFHPQLLKDDGNDYSHQFLWGLSYNQNLLAPHGSYCVSPLHIG